MTKKATKNAQNGRMRGYFYIIYAHFVQYYTLNFAKYAQPKKRCFTAKMLEFDPYLNKFNHFMLSIKHFTTTSNAIHISQNLN